MKKVGVSIVLLVLAFSIIPLVLGEVGADCSEESDCGLGESCIDGKCASDTESEDSEDTNNSTTSSEDEDSDDEASDKDKIKDGFKCLEDKVKDCSGLTTQELALTILATPEDDTFDDCVDELEDRKKNDNWGNIRDSALAIMALSHAGENTEASEDWLLSKARNPSELVWYLEQDSSEDVECNIQYDSNGYGISVGENKKIVATDLGSCLSKAQSSFWLKVTSDCYDKKFQIECDKDFIATLLYKNKNSPTLFVLDGTESAKAYNKIELEINSKCFGDTSCDFEGTAWATLALLGQGHDIEEYIPYVIAMANTNKQYLPDSFIYALTNYEDYATKLFEDQKLGDYWQAPNSAYNKYYDTSLALLSIGSSSSEKVTKSRDWLLFSQGSNGCWGNSIRDTSIVLWALEGRAGRISGAGSSGSALTYCSEANFFCIPNSECPSDEDVGDNFFCSGTSNTCCKTENLKTCEAYGGQVCEGDLVCTGNVRKSSDETSCCTGECSERSTEPEEEVSECEDFGYSCEASCSDTQEELDYSCDGASESTCCRTKREPTSSGSLWWVWVLIILILLVGGAIAYIKREELKLWWFKTRSKFKKDDGNAPKPSNGPRGPPGMGPGMPPRQMRPPRPGFPPVRRMPAAGPRPTSRPPKDHPEMNDTFKKLREIAQK